MNLTDQNIFQIIQIALILLGIFICLNILVAVSKYLKVFPKLGLLKYLKADIYPEQISLQTILKKYSVNKKR
jgi:hypothetical protein